MFYHIFQSVYWNSTGSVLQIQLPAQHSVQIFQFGLLTESTSKLFCLPNKKPKKIFSPLFFPFLSDSEFYLFFSSPTGSIRQGRTLSEKLFPRNTMSLKRFISALIKRALSFFLKLLFSEIILAGKKQEPWKNPPSFPQTLQQKHEFRPDTQMVCLPNPGSVGG